MTSCETTDAVFFGKEDLTTSFFFIDDAAATDTDFFRLDECLDFKVPRALEASIVVLTFGWVRKDTRHSRITKAGKIKSVLFGSIAGERKRELQQP